MTKVAIEILRGRRLACFFKPRLSRRLAAILRGDGGGVAPAIPQQGQDVQDIIWIGLGVVLVAAALIYVRLSDGA